MDHKTAEMYFGLKKDGYFVSKKTLALVMLALDNNSFVVTDEDEFNNDEVLDAEHALQKEINKQNGGDAVVPKGYEKMRDSFKKDGMSLKAAQTKAARIWNSKHPKNPVGRGKK
jgi:hypothetical protein